MAFAMHARVPGRGYERPRSVSLSLSLSLDHACVHALTYMFLYMYIYIYICTYRDGFCDARARPRPWI